MYKLIRIYLFSDEENIAVISVFYDYPVSEKDENKR